MGRVVGDPCGMGHQISSGFEALTPAVPRAFSVLHQRRKGLRGPDHAVDIDAERPLDGVGLAGQNGRANANACIDPQQIKRAMGP